MRDERKYFERVVEGMFAYENPKTKKFKIKPVNVIVRYTHDSKGKSLSFQCDEGMIMIPCESIEDC